MLQFDQVWDAALKNWARWVETGEPIWYDRSMGLFATCWRLVK